MSKNQKMIQMIDVYKSYKLGKTKVIALKGINLHIKEGEFVSIIGPSGSGKSTLLNLIGCLDRPDNGKILLDSEYIGDLSRNRLAEIRITKIGFVFQTFNLIPVLNVYENIEFPLYIKKEPLEGKEKRKRILSLIESVGLSDHINHKPDELSGGQRQRVAVARALVTKPKIVLADEPTANLDSKTGRSIIELAHMLNKEENITFVFATHDQTIIDYTAECYYLKDGTLTNKRLLR